MRYRRLGTTGTLVSEVVLGAAMIGELITPEDVDAVDIGDIYAEWASEASVGRALRRHGDWMLVFAEVGEPVERHAETGAGRLDHAARWRQGIGPNDEGLSRLHVVRAVQRSPTRLGGEHIDLNQVHRWDSQVPIEETLHAVDDLVRAGTVRYVGCSNYAGRQLVDVLWAAREPDPGGTTRQADSSRAPGWRPGRVVTAGTGTTRPSPWSRSSARRPRSSSASSPSSRPVGCWPGPR